jgi:exonuclease VII small subunit
MDLGRYIETIVRSADLVSRARDHIERLMVSLARAQTALESSNLLLRDGAALEGPGTYWLALDRHFAHHAEQVARFSGAKRSAVRRMWKTQTNEYGQPLSEFERAALIERHCELFGVWPQ